MMGLPPSYSIAKLFLCGPGGGVYFSWIVFRNFSSSIRAWRA